MAAAALYDREGVHGATTPAAGRLMDDAGAASATLPCGEARIRRTGATERAWRGSDAGAGGRTGGRRRCRGLGGSGCGTPKGWGVGGRQPPPPAQRECERWPARPGREQTEEGGDGGMG